MDGLEDSDVVIAMDADNTHTPSLIPDIIAKIEEGLDLVIASRYAPGGKEVGLSWTRKLLSRGASTFLRLSFHIPGARDCTCGYRGYRVGMLRRAFQIYGENLVEESGFVCMAELLVKLAMIGARIGEVPLVLRYDRKTGKSKMKAASTIARYYSLSRRRRQISSAAEAPVR